MTESTGFTIRVVEIAVSIPAGRTLVISKVAELVDGEQTAIMNVLREHKDAGLPWWRIIADDGSPLFGDEFSGRALERYLLEATPIVPSSSDFGFAVDIAASAPPAAAVSEIATVMADPEAGALGTDPEETDDRVENAPEWAGAPVSARTAQASTTSRSTNDSDADDASTDVAGESTPDDAANADATGDAPPSAPGFSFDALLRGESNDQQNRTV